MKEKECKKCHRFLPLPNFNKQIRSKDGLSSYCKECNSKRNNEYRERVKREIERGQRQIKIPKKKECRKCLRVLPASKFTKNIMRSDGLDSYCIACDHERQEEYRNRPKVKMKLEQYQKNYRSRPEVKERKRKHHREYAKKPEYKQWKREYAKRPEVKLKKKEYNKRYRARPEVRERLKQYQEKYYSKPENIERRKQYLYDYVRRPEIRDQRRKYVLEYKRKHITKTA